MGRVAEPLARRQVTADLGHELSGRPRYELARNRLILAAQHHPSTQNRLLVTKLAFRPIHRLHQCRSSRPCLPVFTCSTLGSWRHNVPQRQCRCANLAQICTLSVISSEPLPSSNLVTQSRDLKSIQDGRGIYSIVTGVFCA